MPYPLDGLPEVQGQHCAKNDYWQLVCPPVCSGESRTLWRLIGVGSCSQRLNDQSSEICACGD